MLMFSVESFLMGASLLWSYAVYYKQNDKETESNRNSSMSPVSFRDTHVTLAKEFAGLALMGLFLGLFVENTVWTQTVLGIDGSSGLGIFRRVAPMQSLFVVMVMCCALIASINGPRIMLSLLPNLVSGYAISLIVDRYYDQIMGGQDTLARHQLSWQIMVGFALGFFVVGELVRIMIGYIDRESGMLTRSVKSVSKLLPDLDDQIWMVVFAQSLWLFSLVWFTVSGSAKSVYSYGKYMTNMTASESGRISNKGDDGNPLWSPVTVSPLFMYVGFLCVACCFMLIRSNIDLYDIELIIILAGTVMVIVALTFFSVNVAKHGKWLSDGYTHTIVTVITAVATVLTGTLTFYNATSMSGYICLIGAMWCLVYFMYKSTEILSGTVS